MPFLILVAANLTAIGQDTPPEVAPPFPPMIPVLTYHDVNPNSHVQENIPPEIFAKQLDFIQANGFESIFAREYIDILLKRRPAPRRGIVIAFDDAHVGVVRYAVPLLEERGMRATFFVITSSVFEQAPATRLTWNDLRGAIDRGVLEVQSHSYQHADLTQLDDETLQMNLARSRSDISSHLGTFCSLIAYPYGAYNANVKWNTYFIGYDAGFTVGYRRFETEPIDFYEIKRVNTYADWTDETIRWPLGLDVLPPLPSFLAPEEWFCYR